MPDDIPKLPRQRGKKNQPKDTAWKQQKLPALRPHYNIASAIPVTLITGVATLAMGIALYFGHNGSLESEVVYTTCTLQNGTEVNRIMRTDMGNETFKCSYSIILEEDYTGDVKFYYSLTKFYQNNRLYFNSRNDQQLRGKVTETDGCDPLEYVLDKNGTKIPIAPCGVVANSMFNDTFQLFYMNSSNGTGVPVPWTTRGVLGATEMKRKFRNPVRKDNQTLCEAFQNTIKPPSWRYPICQLGLNSLDDVGVGFENVDFMVWMKVAALPNFRKLYRILNRQVEMFRNGLPKGTYQLVINYNYPVDSYNGEKAFIIASENWVGQRNLFLPVIYLVVGTFLLLVTILFILIWLKQRLSRVHPT